MRLLDSRPAVLMAARTSSMEVNLSKILSGCAAEIKSEISAIASSHLNICAILSNLRKHEEALIHSEKASKLLESARLNCPDNTRILSNLVISYYNSAVELEFLGKFQECFDNYTLAYKVCREIRNNHPLLYSIEKTMQKIRTNKLGKLKKVFNEERSTKNHSRFPSVTPTLPKIVQSRTVMTPVKVYTGRNSPYDDLKSVSLKRSM